MTKTTQSAHPSRDPEPPESLTCGLVMPISPIDGLSADHWVEVKSILSAAVESIVTPRFAVKLVSDADEIGIIQKRIVQNVYSSDILVCDVSAKNPNVMFELGMRLAFDKPVVIVKDDTTDYSFDTGIIEHLTYPRDLRFAKIVDFKEALATKVAATYRASRSDSSPFLKSFGSFHVASLTQTEVSPDKLLLEMVEEVRRDVNRLARRIDTSSLSTRQSKHRSGDAITVERFVIDHWSTVPGRGPIVMDDDLILKAEAACDAPRTYAIRSEFVEALQAAVDAFNTAIKGF